MALLQAALLLTRVWTVLLAGRLALPWLGPNGATLIAFAAATALSMQRMPARRGRRQPWAAALAGSLVGMIGFPAWTAAIAAIGRALGLSPPAAPLWDPGDARVWLSMVVLAPVFEEQVYRGHVLGAVRSKLGAPAAIAVSSALFALPHAGAWGVLGAALTGVVLAVVRLLGGRLAVCIGLHAGLNASVLVRGVPRDAFEPLLAVASQPALLQPVALCGAFWVAVRGFRRRVPDGAHAGRFAFGLGLGAVLAHAGWLALYPQQVWQHPWAALDPTLGFCVLFVPLGPWLVAPRSPAPAATSQRVCYLAAALGSLPLALATARLGCIAAGCCGGVIAELPWLASVRGNAVVRHPTAVYEIAGWLALHWIVARARPSLVAPVVAIGTGLIRLAVDPWRVSPPLGAPLLPVPLLACGWVAVGGVLGVRSLRPKRCVASSTVSSPAAGRPIAAAPRLQQPTRRSDQPPMGRVIVLLLLVAAAWLVVNAIHFGASRPSVDGRRVIVATEDYEVRFSRGGSEEASYMVFGGIRGGAKNGFTDATLSTLTIAAARSIGRSFPDFYLCHSAGAAKAQQWIEAIHFVAASGSVRKTLNAALDLHEQRLGEGGERTCLTVRGSEMQLDSIRAKDGGADLTSRVSDALSRSRFVLAQAVELAECRALLR